MIFRSLFNFQFSSVQSLSRVWLFATPWIAACQASLFPHLFHCFPIYFPWSDGTRCPSQTPGVHSDSSPLSQWCHPAISSSVGPFSSRLENTVALTQEQTPRSGAATDSRNKPTTMASHALTRRQEYTMEKRRQTLQQVVLGKVEKCI